MARLPKPGGDNGNWGTILNDYLSQSLDADGVIKDESISAGQLSSAVQSTLAKADTATQPADLAQKYTKPADGIPISDIKKSDLDSQYTGVADTVANRGIRRGPVTIWLGDSITQNLNTLTDQTQPLLGEGFATLVANKSGQRILYSRNAGVTNDTVELAAARLQASVIDFKPDRCQILLGTNNTNLTSGPTLAQTMVTYEDAIIKPLITAGIEPIIYTIPPRNGVRTSEPATYRKQATWNAFLRGVANKYRLPLVDAYALLADSTTGDYKSGYTGDGVHPNKVAYQALSSGAVTALNAYYPEKGVPMEQDRYSAISLAPNPLFLEGLTGTGNILPTGWTGSTTGIAITLDDPVNGDGLEAGKWFTIKKNVTDSTKNVNWIRSFAALSTAGNPIAVGDRLSWAFRYKIADSIGIGANAYITVALRYTNSGGTNVKIITPINQFELDSTGVVYFEGTVPAGAANLRFDLSFSTTSVQTLSVGQMTVRNLTGLGLSSLLGAS